MMSINNLGVLWRLPDFCGDVRIDTFDKEKIQEYNLTYWA